MFHIKLTSCVAIDGLIHKAGSVIECAERVALDFLNRGKAVLATEFDAVEHALGIEDEPEQPAPAETEEPAAPAEVEQPKED